MDAYIVEQAGLSVTEIFDRFGEADFRRREREACRELARRSGCVIATGGGALTFPENTAALAEAGPIVLLDVEPAVLLQRLTGDASRPLLAGPDRERKFWELYRARLPLYKGSRLRDRAGGPGRVPLRKAADKVLAALGERPSQDRPGAERRPSLCVRYAPIPSKKRD